MSDFVSLFFSPFPYTFLSAVFHSHIFSFLSPVHPMHPWRCAGKAPLSLFFPQHLLSLREKFFGVLIHVPDIENLLNAVSVEEIQLIRILKPVRIKHSGIIKDTGIIIFLRDADPADHHFSVAAFQQHHAPDRQYSFPHGILILPLRCLDLRPLGPDLFQFFQRQFPGTHSEEQRIYVFISRDQSFINVADGTDLLDRFLIKDIQVIL